MSLFAELKRRNVIRVAIAYVVVAWLVLQVTDILVPALRLPDWVPSLVIFFGIIGFPFAMLFAWAYELTPDGIKREADVDRTASITRTTGRRIDKLIIVLLVIGVGYLLFDRFVPGGSESTEPAVAYDSIAVLPFENRSDDSDKEYFSDGLSEALMNALSRIPELKVAARTSSFSFKGEQPDPRVVGESLGVSSVLMGSVQTSGNELRVGVQLVDTASGFQIWADSYDRDLTDVFDVQDDITEKILGELRVRLSEDKEPVVATTRNTEAYDHYLRGLEALRKRHPASIAEAQRHFAAATATDPRFAEAWSRQALATYMLSDAAAGEIPRQEAEALARTMLERAFEIAPELADAHAVNALLLADDYRFEDALESNARAIAAQPSSAEAYLWRTETLTSIGRIREADEAIEKAYELDPLHPAIIFTRNSRRCEFFRERPSDDEVAKLLAGEDSWQGAPFMCFGRTGHYAEMFQRSQDMSSRWFAGIWPHVILKDCDPPIPPRNARIQKIIGLVACRKDQEALDAYAELSQGEQDLRVLQEWIAIAQMRLGLYERALASLDRAHDGRIPVTGQAGVNGISSNASLALDRVLAYEQLGMSQDEGREIKSRVQAVVDNFKAEEISRGYHLLESKLLLLDGYPDEAIQLLQFAAEDRGIGWYDRLDPVLLEYLGEDLIAEVTQSLDEHIDDERAKLGWEPAGF